jgi:hypothetical protein
MIRLQKNQVNQIFVTLTELSTISSPYYICSLLSNNTRETKNFRFSTNLSPNKYRWDIFNIELVSAANLEDLEDAKVFLQSGTYDYVIYETSATTGTSIALQNKVETGLLIVEQELTANTVYTSNTINNYVVYGKQ